MCGKNVPTVTPVDTNEGSPPRVREKLVSQHFERLEDRITPACAGKTDCHGGITFNDRDHPRVCGKNHGIPVGIQADEGSPPRVREKRPVNYYYVVKMGITPACAGKTK